MYSNKELKNVSLFKVIDHQITIMTQDPYAIQSRLTRVSDYTYNAANNVLFCSRSPSVN